MAQAKWIGLMVAVGLTLSGCGGKLPGLFEAKAPDQPATAIAPAPPPDETAAVPENARTVDEFDTTTAAERAAAADVPPVERPERELGKIVAALGDPTAAGFWAKTPLVKDVQQGRLVYAANGNSVLVELRPVEGDASGTQVSLPAMRILGAPLAGLPELIVYAR